MTAAAQSLSFGEVLKLPGVARLWAAQLVSVFGDFLAIFGVIGVITFRLHGSATDVSLVIVSFMVPLAFVGPIAGAFVDRWNVRHTMIGSDLIRAALIALLIYARDLNRIYLIFFLLSAVSSFFFPAQSIAVRAIVPNEGLMSANALMAQAQQAMQIITPAVAGILVAWIGADVCYLLDALSFLFSAAMLCTVAIDHRPPPGKATLRSISASVVEGMRFIFTHGAVTFVILAMTAGMFAVRCFSALLAVYVRDILTSDSRLYGALSSSVGLGMIAGTQLLNRFAKGTPKNQLVVTGLAGVGVSILGVAIGGNPAGTLIGMLALGFFVAFIMIPSQTLLQQETPREMLGRVSSSLWSVLAVAQIAALAAAGPVAQSIGIGRLYYASGFLLIGFAAAAYAQMRRHSAVTRS